MSDVTVEILFKAVQSCWVCVRPGDPGYSKPLRQNRYLASGKPRSRSGNRKEWAGNRIFLDGRTHWIKLPATMFCGLLETMCIAVNEDQADEAMKFIDVGGSRRDRLEFYHNHLSLYKRINEQAYSLAGKEGDYEGAEVWRKKMNLVVAKVENMRPAGIMNSDELYLNT